jgi:hypothetical protein
VGSGRFKIDPAFDAVLVEHPSAGTGVAKLFAPDLN